MPPFTPPVPLLLNRSDIGSLLSLETSITSVEAAFAAHARGESLSPALMHVDADGGEFHVKAGGLRAGGRTYFTLKANGGFFQNRARHGLPNIQGLIYLADGANGCPLAVLDSRDVTILRTGAATAVAVRHLARPGAKVATVCGCGVQGRIQVRALAAVLPLEQIYVWSRDAARAADFAATMSREFGLPVKPAESLPAALAASDVVVTCTPAKKYFIEAGWVKPGTLVAAIGSDSPDKQEVDPRLLAQNAVVCDLVAQCAEVGDLHHALRAGLMRVDQVRAELGQVIAGLKPGRISADEIIVFDSTGTALQDAAVAVAAYQRALASGRGTPFAFTA